LETIVSDNPLEEKKGTWLNEQEQKMVEDFLKKMSETNDKYLKPPPFCVTNRQEISGKGFRLGLGSTPVATKNGFVVIGTGGDIKKWISDNTLKTQEKGFFAANKEPKKTAYQMVMESKGFDAGGYDIPPIRFMKEPKEDSIVNAVCEDLKKRSAVGIKKYGTTLDRKDLSLKDWLQHAYEENADQLQYLKKCIVTISSMEQILSQTNIPLDVPMEEKLATLVEFWNANAMAKTEAKK
jgi:hypothetical protein